jgi:hypothetical protein
MPDNSLHSLARGLPKMRFRNAAEMLRTPATKRQPEGNLCCFKAFPEFSTKAVDKTVDESSDDTLDALRGLEICASGHFVSKGLSF